MILKTLHGLEHNQFHHYWKAHAYCMSKSTPSPLPSEILFLILRLVPTTTYLNLYDMREPLMEFDCENRHDPWSYSDLDAPKAFGDY
jgi:hypothetical protein